MPGYFRIELSGGAELPPESKAPLFTSSENGVRIWSDGPAVTIGNHGIIIGHLFSHPQPSQRVHQLPQEAVDAVMKSGGRSLLTDYWGGYIAVLIRSDGQISILRDPSGTIPCYYRSTATGWIVGCDFREVADSIAQVDYGLIGRLLVNPDAIGRSTCIKGVDELLAGEALNISNNILEIETWWSPWDHIDHKSGMDFHDAAIQLRQITQSCGSAWASCFHDVSLGVSGGLDSSIVAATATTSSKLHCYTMRGSDRESDESHYAKILTDSFGIDLAEYDYDLHDIDVAASIAPHQPRPIASFYAQSIMRAHQILAKAWPIDAYFSGNGGDNIFFNTRSIAPFLDRFLAEGPGIGLKATLRDLGDLTGTDTKAILKTAWSRFTRKNRNIQLRSDFSGLSDQMILQIKGDKAVHPWLVAHAKSLPGKSDHIALLLRAHKSVELYPRLENPPHIAPLLSQPVVEFCLSIPTWQWITGGRDRAVAREGFRGALPDVLLQRISKGGPGAFMHAIYTAHAQRIKDQLRDGLLVRHNIIDPAYIDQSDEPTWRGAARTQRLMTMAATENWVQWWNSRR